VSAEGITRGHTFVRSFGRGSERLASTMIFSYSLSVIVRLAEAGVYGVIIAFVAPGDVGVYMEASAFALVVSPVLTWGADRTLIRSFSGGAVSPWRTALAFTRSRAIATLILGCGSVLVLWVSGASSQFDEIFALVALMQVAQVLETPWSAWLRARERQTVANGVGAVIAVLRLAAVSVVIAAGYRAIALVATVMLFVACVSAIATALLAMSYGMRAQVGRAVDKGQTAGTSLAAANLLTVAQNRLDWILVAAWVSPLALAAYGMANKLYEVVNLGVATGLTTLFPFLCRERERVSRNICSALGVLILGTAAIALAIDLAWGVLLPHLPDAYSAVHEILPLFMAAAVFSAFAGGLYNIAVARSRDRSVLGVALLATFAQLGVNLALVPREGGRGAAIGMLVLVVTTGGAYCALARRYALLDGRDLVRFVLTATASAGSILVLGLRPDRAHLVLALLLFVAAIAAVGGFGWLAPRLRRPVHETPDLN
jgi:O-antigen/teichoic acid export membrane protein